ncbi:MAG: PEPxxWA-CTERM sorting domain-containing protein [Aquabacterium sp.]
MIRNKIARAVAALTLSWALPGHAALTHDAGMVVVSGLADFEGFDGLETTGPEVVAPGITFTGDTGSMLGAFIAELGENGIWGAGNHFAATSFVGELRFTFDVLQSAAGALVNHFAIPGLPFSIVVSAYGDNNQIIETHTLMVDTAFDSLNEGLFTGIVRDAADIRSLSFKGNGVVVDDLVIGSPVPEPGTWALMLAGIGMLGASLRRRA